MHRFTLSLIVGASFLFIDRPAHASGDVPPDPNACPDLYAALCVPPGVCAAECGTLCDGDDATYATLACKECQTTLALDAYNACVTPAPPVDCVADLGWPACDGSEAEASCDDDGGCAVGLVCTGCCPVHADTLPHDDVVRSCVAP